MSSENNQQGEQKLSTIDSYEKKEKSVDLTEQIKKCVCQNCGFVSDEPMLYCSNCGYKIDKNEEINKKGRLLNKKKNASKIRHSHEKKTRAFI